MKNGTLRNAAKVALQLIAFLFIGSFLLLLAGCAASEQKVPDVAFTVKEVHIPVPQKCTFEEPAEPGWLTEKLDLHDASALERSQSIMAELEQVRAYLSLYRTAASKCR